MSDSAPETLFAQWIDAQSRGEASDFEAYCAAHPEHADALRRLHRKLELVDRVFGGGAKGATGEPAPPSSWAEQLEKIRRIGAAAERYTRGDEIGRGGMGSVHQVLDHLLERSLAMKVLRAGDDSSVSPTPAGDDRSLGRFLEEALVTARLDHPYIVPVHDLGLDAEGRVYFAMKRVKGEDLRAVFEKIGAGVDEWTTTRGLQILLKVCEAMAYAHSKNVIHRDLKPGNVMVGPFGEVYVMDWGLARILDRPDTKDVRIQPASDGEALRSARRERQADHAATPDAPLVTMDGDVVGTPSYMPLEQAEGDLDRIGPRTDVYAIGAMLYHLLSGRPPYVDDGEKLPPRAILERVKARAPRSLHELAPNAPAELIAIVEKAMARRAKDRYLDMKALAADLQAYLDVRVVSAYETGAIAELKKWVKRNPALSAAAAVVVVVLAGATAVVTQQKREVETKNREVEAKNVALGKANDEITAQKSEVESQKQLADAKILEFDQLAGKVYLERAIEREKDLYPPWPEKIEAMERWLAEDAKRLLDLKPTLESTLADLRARALPQTDEERAHDRTTHPKFAELESLRPRLVWLRSRFAGLAATSPAPIPALPADLDAKTALELNDFAWERVDPDFTKRIFGEEALALAVARRAIALIEAGDETVRPSPALDTLAWACFANGLDSEASSASARALEAAPSDKKAEYTIDSANLEKAIAAHSGEAGAKLLADLEAQVSVLDTAVNARQTYAFALEAETFLYTTLSDLAASIAAFESGAKTDVEQRLAWAKKIGELTLRHPNARVTWDEARAAILKADDLVASKLYASSPGDPIELKPQMGLVPLGMNPATKLWEFYDLRSACGLPSKADPAAIEIPRHSDDGVIDTEKHPGIVFVLLPNPDIHADYSAIIDDSAKMARIPMAKDVVDAAFFIGRHELTITQFENIDESSQIEVDSLAHTLENGKELLRAGDCPATGFSYRAIFNILAKNGLSLPTSSQWEYAARGGSRTQYWTGDSAESLVGVELLRLTGDPEVRLVGVDPVLFTKYMLTPVNMLRANPFGLHRVHGNAWEWCSPLDGASQHVEMAPARGGFNLRFSEGLFGVELSYARFKDVEQFVTWYRNSSLGARPARRMYARKTSTQ